MQNIKDNMKSYKMTDEEKKEVERYLNMSDSERQVEFYNMTEGSLHLEDNINCDVCKNRGYIAIVDNNTMKIKECECMKKRKLYKRFQECGISREQLQNYTFANYRITSEWQKALMDKMKDYCMNLDKSKSWLYLGGNTGSGKTHLCTALFQRLINNGMTGRYMIWNSEISQLVMLKRSFYAENQDKYVDRIEELINCDVLYIDDFMQRDISIDDSLNIAYEIINTRYNDPNKITIISSELLRNDLEQLIGSVFGRIYQRTDSGKYFINIIGNDKNYRLK